MPGKEPSRDEALRSLQERATALENRTTVQPQDYGATAASQAYKILVHLLSGVFIGVAIGAGVDWVAGTRPWGMIVGVLLGFALSVWMAKRTADRLMALAAKEGPPPQAVPFDDEEV